jgi:hypothetical protein
LLDEFFERWPEVPFIICAFPLPSIAEWLAWAASCPDVLFFRPARKFERIVPTPYPCKEMGSLARDFKWLNILNRTLINLTWANVALLGQFS